MQDCPKCGFSGVMHDVNTGCWQCGWKPEPGAELPETVEDVDRKVEFLRSFFANEGRLLLFGFVVLVLLFYSTVKSMNDFLLLTGLFVAAAFLIVLMLRSVRTKAMRVKTVPPDRFYLRNTGSSYTLLPPGHPRLPQPSDVEVSIRPDRQLFQTPAGPRMLRWQPDPENLEAYIEFYRPLRGAEAKTEFIQGVEEFFTLNHNPTIGFLQNRYADHLGVQILTLDLPPDPAKEKPQPIDRRSKAEKEIDRMFAGVKTAAEARRRWHALKQDPDLSAALLDPEVGPKLNGKYEELITRIAEGDI